MKFLKTFLGLFFALFIPILAVVALTVPKDAKVTPMQAMLGASVPVGLILLAVSLGFAVLNHLMDSNKPKQ